MRRAVILALLLATAGVAVTSGPAFAESGVCLSLQQQYLAAALVSTPVPGAAQVAALRASLANAEAAASANHCRSLGIFQPAPTSACPAVLQETDRLQASLRATTGSNAAVGFFGFAAAPPRSPADQLRDALAVNGCAVPDPAGSRALCVRACDGYYFPVSSGGGGAAADAATCQATYGGQAKAEIFVASVSGDVADALSSSGRRYGDQPYAFSYRTKFNAICVAQLQDGVTALATRTPRPAAPVTPVVVAALSKPPAAATAQPNPSPTLAASGGSSPVMRIVGAAYYNAILQQQDDATAHPPPASAAR